MRWWVVLALTTLGCRIHFDPASGDDANGDATVAPLSVTQTGASLPPGTTTTMIAFAPTHAGALLVVGTASIDGSADTVISISDDTGDTFVSAGTLYTCTGGSLGETWYAENARAGATQLTIAQSVSNRREIWFVEVAGIRATGSLVGAAAHSELPLGPTVTSPPITPNATPAFVFAAENVSGSVNMLDTSTGFIAMQNLNGDQAAYTIAMTAGSYAATWTVIPGGAKHCGDTVAFAAGP